MIACIMMVFGALTEYGIILYFMIQKQNCSSDYNHAIRNRHEYDCHLDSTDCQNDQEGDFEHKKVYILDKKTMIWMKETGEKKDEKSGRSATFGENILKNADSFSLILFSSLFLPFTIIYSIMLHH